MHILRQVVSATTVFTRGAGTLPSTKGLETRPGACGCSLRAVDVVDTRFNVLEVPVDFVL